MSTMTMAAALNAALRDELSANDSVVLIGEDIGTLGGVFRVTDTLQADFGRQRVIDAPLAEPGIIGTSVGMGCRALRPVCEIRFDGFVDAGFDQLVAQVAKLHYRTRGKVRMPLTVRIPYGGGIGAVEHHSESPEAYFAHTAGLRVVTAASPQEAYQTLRAAIASDDPAMLVARRGRHWTHDEVDRGAGADTAPAGTGL